MKSLDLSYELPYWQHNQLVIGVDEVGRGCLAGPVVVGAVCFPINHHPIPEINDSKQVSKLNRAKLELLIKTQALAYGIGEVDAKTIDTIGIVAAIQEAANQAIKNLTSHLEPSTKIIIILSDGPKPLHTPIHSSLYTIHSAAIVKGDAKVYSIAAASIFAKVYRDNLMSQIHHQYPEYDWINNVGYGTKKHLEAIKKFGLTPHHRQTFCH